MLGEHNIEKRQLMGAMKPGGAGVGVQMGRKGITDIHMPLP